MDCNSRESETVIAIWHLSRRCSMSPRAFMLHWAAALAVLQVVGLSFTLAGYPWIWAFCTLHSAGLAAAALLHMAHAADGERLVLTPKTVDVAATRGLHTTQVQLDTRWTRLERVKGHRPLALCCGRKRLEVAGLLEE